MDWIPVGRVTKVHGLKGELKLYPSMDNIWVADTKQIRLSRSNPAQEFVEYIIQSIRGKGTPLIIKFSNIDSIDAARELLDRPFIFCETISQIYRKMSITGSR